MLFVIADKDPDNDKQDELFAGFEKHEEPTIGQGGHEELHAMIDQWSEEFPIQ